MKILYTAEASAHGGREGHVHSADGVLDLDLAVPESMGGSGGSKTNPEELFEKLVCPYSNATRNNIDVTLTVV